MAKILILANNDGGLYKFRKELIEELVKKHKVFISLPYGGFIPKLKELGCKYIETPISRRSTNPVADLKLLMKYKNIIKITMPDVVLTYTIKPNVYGGLACRILGVPYIANITGLGTSIENKGLVRTISLTLYKVGLKKSSCVFFQNKNNRSFFIKNRILSTSKVREIPGSGVNLNQHVFEEYPIEDGNIRFLFIGRIMRAKGIVELFEAARIIKHSYPNTEFHIIGGKEEDFDSKLKELEAKGIIRYHGYQKDVQGFIKNSHAIVNPSYHEGMSNVLLEAASTGRPVLATNIPGCKETFDEGVSGFGFEVKSVESLVKAAIKFIELPYEEKKKMGLAGRKKMEKEFDRSIVIEAYLDEIKSAVKEK